MATINKNFRKLAAGYLFPKLQEGQTLIKRENPDKVLHRLGIGNTTEALSSSIVEALHRKIDLLANNATYSGYGDEQGDAPLREAIVDYYKSMGISLDSDEVFVSDGAKPDAANVQNLFGLDNVVAIQDPAYPVYVDSNVVAGRSVVLIPH